LGHRVGKTAWSTAQKTAVGSDLYPYPPNLTCKYIEIAGGLAKQERGYPMFQCLRNIKHFLPETNKDGLSNFIAAFKQ